MKKITAFVSAIAVVSSVSAAFAGGPIVIKDEGEPVAIKACDGRMNSKGECVIVMGPGSSAGSLAGGAIIPIIGGLVLISLAANGSGSH